MSATPLAFVTSAFSSYSGCRQYREDLASAQQDVGEGAPEIQKLRPYFDHPGFIEPMAANVDAALATLPAALRTTARLVFTAHSIPLSMASTSDYETQLREASRLVAERSSGTHEWDLVYQSRSGPPSQPWLEPDIVDHLTRLHAEVCDAVVVVPVGFTSDHLEVRYDLDTQAKARADELGLPMARAATVGTDPAFVALIRELVLEVVEPRSPVRRLSDLPDPGWCSATCCPPPPAPALSPRPQVPAGVRRAGLDRVWASAFLAAPAAWPVGSLGSGHGLPNQVEHPRVGATECPSVDEERLSGDP